MRKDDVCIALIPASDTKLILNTFCCWWSGYFYYCSCSWQFYVSGLSQLHQLDADISKPIPTSLRHFY